jgi:hypothetical protein
MRRAPMRYRLDPIERTARDRHPMEKGPRALVQRMSGLF